MRHPCVTFLQAAVYSVGGLTVLRQKTISSAAAAAKRYMRRTQGHHDQFETLDFFFFAASTGLHDEWIVRLSREGCEFGRGHGTVKLEARLQFAQVCICAEWRLHCHTFCGETLGDLDCFWLS